MKNNHHYDMPCIISHKCHVNVLIDVFILSSFLLSFQALELRGADNLVVVLKHYRNFQFAETLVSKVNTCITVSLMASFK